MPSYPPKSRSGVRSDTCTACTDDKNRIANSMCVYYLRERYAIAEAPRGARHPPITLCGAPHSISVVDSRNRGRGEEVSQCTVS